MLKPMTTFKLGTPIIIDLTNYVFPIICYCMCCIFHVRVMNNVQNAIFDI